MEKTWPDWDESYKEFKPAVDRLIEEETSSLLKSDNFQSLTTHQSIEKKNVKVAKIPKPTGQKLLHKTEVNLPQTKRVSPYWWYALLAVSIFLGFIVLRKKCIQKK